MRRALRLALVLTGVATLGSPAADPDASPVDPAELTKHPEWIGREVAVDARVRFFQRNDEGERAELVLKRGNVLFRLPARLRPERNGEIHAVRVRGILRREGKSWFCDVNAMTPLPRDLERLEQVVGSLARTDFERRAAWGRWAQRRAEEYDEKDDQALKDRGRALEVEAIRTEADHADTKDQSAHWLRLAQRMRERHLPDLEAGALAHRAFRARLKEAKTAADLDKLRQQIVAFFPEAQTPSSTDTSDWLDRYAREPAEAYREAPEAVRTALNRRLLADAIEQSLKLQAAGKALDGENLMALAEQAKLQLPDRPELGKGLDEQGLEAAARHPESLRESDIKRYAKAFEALGQRERARALERAWLEQQRRNLSATDAEGRLILAKQYDNLLHDEETAADLIKEALKIDPRYADAEKALKAHGYRKLNDAWVKPTADRPAGGADAGESDPSTDGSLRGLTPPQVKLKMGGKPDEVIRLATQGQMVEQWVYRLSSGTKYIRIVRRPDMPQAVVDADHTLH